MKDEDVSKIDGENFSAYFGNRGNIEKIVFKDKRFEPPLNYTLYEINGEMAHVSEARGGRALSLKLSSKEASGKLTISSGEEIRFHFEPDKKDATKTVSLVIPFPIETEFHIPEGRNIGRKIDSEMPIEERYAAKLHYNFILAYFEGLWIRLMVRQSRLSSADVRI